MTLSEVKKLASQCVKAAKEAWWENFELSFNHGDGNREAIGRIADTLLRHCLCENIESSKIKTEQ